MSRHPPARLRRATSWLAGVLALTLMVPAHAWGPLGHRLVARLAEDGLGPRARAGIARLLGGEQAADLAAIATWADALRARDPLLGRRSAPWHYVNIGDSACRYVPARDCPGGDCLVGALDTQSRILADATRSDADRLQALKFVVHLVADAHQPLHAGHRNDRGGNTYQLHHDGRGTNLHAFWDSGLLGTRRMGEAAWLARLRATPAPAATPLPAGGAAAWAMESCRLTNRPGFYPAGHVAHQAYVDAHLPLAERQLRLAGARLAAVLNAAFDQR